MKPMPTALTQGYIRCHECGHLIKSKVQSACPVCKNSVPIRRHQDLHLTTALIISSFCLYIPANIFPIMTVTEFGITARHTIAGGIVVLIQKDLTPIAMLVLVASILVPLMKLLGHKPAVVSGALPLASQSADVYPHVSDNPFHRPLVPCWIFL